MTTGLKVWLWIVLVLNAISTVISLIAALVAPVLWISVIAGILIIVGAIMLLQTKRIGFYLICGAAVINLIVNIISGRSIAMALVSAIVMPLIIYFLMKNTWNQFE